MTITGVQASTSKSTTTTDRPVPRWAELVAHAIPLLLLPQCLWRLPFAFGFEMGMEDMDIGSLWISVPYIFGLSLTTEALALLCFGLVRRWGVIVPEWVPVLRGRRIPPYVALVPATLGGLGATLLWGPFLLSVLGVPGFEGPGQAPGAWQLLFNVCVLPATLWGPLVLALTVQYYLRRRPVRA
ncbi:hypothetical protein [Streptomyces sp. NBC_01304]|uniref:hypothetical protein n=1 Tax=Streptomyces sp. NBC_01304 TaxID=2903818 RepID=UPI002E167639|nr:hypothetical protein OG430_11920 [Streptomyces sp. NBC_01304]